MESRGAIGYVKEGYEEGNSRVEGGRGVNFVGTGDRDCCAECEGDWDEVVAVQSFEGVDWRKLKVKTTPSMFVFERR